MLKMSCEAAALPGRGLHQFVDTLVWEVVCRVLCRVVCRGFAEWLKEWFVA